MIQGVDVVHWNPRRRWRLGNTRVSLPLIRTVQNFGDVLSPILVGRMLSARGISESSSRHQRLLAIGSILHLARDGDTVWGSGVNGKIPIADIVVRSLDVTAVRGPRTAEVLSSLGFSVADVFGDPGLLIPDLLGVTKSPEARFKVTSIPNLNDLAEWSEMPGLLDPRSDYMTILQRIAQSHIVISSSLHGLVMADALGVPASWFVSLHEAEFKYQDYLEGTGRYGARPCSTLNEAFDNPLPPLKWNHAPLFEAFPGHLWRA